jgi:hypothetical protein
MNRSVKLSHLVIALAVIAALAVVSPAVGGPSLKSLVKKEVAKQIAGKTGPPGPAGATGGIGATGATGATGAAGSAVAFAHINANGTLDGPRSKNIAGVSFNDPAKYYCVRTSVPVTNAVASIGGVSANGASVTTFTGDPFTSCSGSATGAQFQFVTFNAGGALAASEFWVVFN